MPNRLTEQLLKQNIPAVADALLGEKTWYEVGGSAEALVIPETMNQLIRTVNYCLEHSIELRILGGGANLLVCECGVKGVVVQLDHASFKQLEVEDHERTGDVLVHVGAGYDLMKLVQELARLGLSGLECMAGIPGTLGGAIRMNAGGAYGEIGTTVMSVAALSLSNHNQGVHTLKQEELSFSYRFSNLKDWLIIGAQLKLKREKSEVVRKSVKEIFAYKKNSQPMAGRSAGCAFKNPNKENPAGKLIDQSGLKGLKLGGAEVSTVHANFMVLKPEGKAEDVANLMRDVQKRVLEATGIELKMEVVIWPETKNEG